MFYRSFTPTVMARSEKEADRLSQKLFNLLLDHQDELGIYDFADTERQWDNNNKPAEVSTHD
jgi:hypothetical protein